MFISHFPQKPEGQHPLVAAGIEDEKYMLAKEKAEKLLRDKQEAAKKQDDRPGKRYDDFATYILGMFYAYKLSMEEVEL